MSDTSLGSIGTTSYFVNIRQETEDGLEEIARSVVLWLPAMLTCANGFDMGNYRKEREQKEAKGGNYQVAEQAQSSSAISPNKKTTRS